MTEQEWLESGDPKSMLDFMARNGSERKLRLFACVCTRQFSHMLVPQALEQLKVAEQFADGLSSSEERKLARDKAFHVPWLFDDKYRHRRGPAKACVADSLARRPRDAAMWVSRRALGIGRLENYPAGEQTQATKQSNLLRDIFGNPFRPVRIDPAWLMPKVTALAQSIYDERRFADMLLLAGALEEAGCTNASILDHCRQTAEHVRGCWVVDLILGKA